jgi:hypothetical protein
MSISGHQLRLEFKRIQAFREFPSAIAHEMFVDADNEGQAPETAAAVIKRNNLGIISVVKMDKIPDAFVSKCAL